MLLSVKKIWYGKYGVLLFKLPQGVGADLGHVQDSRLHHLNDILFRPKDAAGINLHLHVHGGILCHDI